MLVILQHLFWKYIIWHIFYDYLLWNKINNFYCNTLYFHQNHFTHHWSYVGYTTTFILKIIALAYFFMIIYYEKS